ncbi:MAG: tetratricopeptide repeat protein [Chloroflexi bacterium]|nr:tetratricopeptide repeat protein [Chloroflexota bacterium]
MANHALPLALTRFIGREKAIVEITRLINHPGLQSRDGLPRTRLLTLTGSGGCGKTRLALEIATRLTDAFEHNVAWIEFAPLSDGARVPDAVANALDVRASAEQSLTQTLADFLRPQQFLLVFDNCEHLIGACAQIAEALLRACPRVSILATSRESLNVPGEIAWRVPPLEIPNPQTTTAPETLLASESARLFIDRANLVDQTFSAHDHHAHAIAQICFRLDGMPLAIELAAARVKALAVEQIAARLNDRFYLLTTGKRTAPTRQQTLRATIDWSYGLLSSVEKILFQRLAVFAGGWTLDAAESICADVTTGRHGDAENKITASEIFDVLSRLVDKSLVNVEMRDSETRYRMLETIRQYAHEKLNDAREVEMMRARHCDFFIQLAETAEPQLKGPDAKEWMDRLERDYANLRAVFEYATTNDVAAAARLAWALVMLWVRRAYLIEGRNVLIQLLARPEAQAPTRLRLSALKTIGYLQIYTQDSDAVRAYFEEGLAIANMLEDENEIAFTLHGVGRAFIFLHDYPAARPFIEESLILYRQIGGQWGEAQSLYSLGTVIYELGECERAQMLMEESLEKFQQIGDICDTVWPLNSLGLFARDRGDYTGAIALYETCLDIDRRVDDRIHLGMAMIGLGWTVLQQGDYRRAVELYPEMLEIIKRRGRPVLFVQWLIATASVIRGLGKPAVAAQILGAADGLFELFVAKGISNPVYRRMYDRSSSGVRAELSAEIFAQNWQTGRALDLEQAIAFALSEMKFSDSPDPRAASLSPRQIAKEKFDGLTAREREVAALIAQGQSNREIAEMLVLSERTIEGHVGNILNKLGFNARTQIAAWATQKGLT